MTLITAAIFLVTIVLLWRLIFKTWATFLSAVKYAIIPDILSAAFNRFEKDVDYSTKFYGFIVLCGLCLWGEYELIQLVSRNL